MRVGYIPYLNMAPFHHGFGPEPVDADGVHFQFEALSPHALGEEAAAGRIEAGALSIADLFRLDETFEPLGTLGIGVKRAAQSVILFSDRPMAELSGTCAVTADTSTSVQLLRVLLERKYSRPALTYGRIASSLLYDGSANAVLLIGDDALRNREMGIRGLPIHTDLGEEWFAWQNTPFAFARWAVKRDVPTIAKQALLRQLESAIGQPPTDSTVHVLSMALDLAPAAIRTYWNGFQYQLTPAHEQSIATFKTLMSDSLAGSHA